VTHRTPTLDAALRLTLGRWAILAVALTPVPSLAQQPAATPVQAALPDAADPRFKVGDYIQTRAGVVLWGQLKRVEFGSAAFEIINVDEVSVKVADIAVLIARSAEFQVDLKREDRFTSRIEAGSQPGFITVSRATGRAEVPVADVVRLRRNDTTFLQRLDGTVSAGYSYTSASDIGRFTFLQAAIFATERNQLFQHYSTVVTYGDGKDGADRVDAGIGDMFAVRGRYLIAQYVQYQTIASTGIDHRWLSISGGGVRLIHARFVNLDVVSGVTFTQEKVTTGESSDTQVELPLMLLWDLGGPAPRIRVSGRSGLFKSLSVNDRYRLDVRLEVDYEVFTHSAYGSITIGSQILFNGDSRPLTEAQKKKDVNTSVNIGYTF
jgi:hypothetical protein